MACVLREGGRCCSRLIIFWGDKPFHDTLLCSSIIYSCARACPLASQDDPCVPGAPLKKGSKVRLFHVSTRKWLHSHLYQSPLTNSQEVLRGWGLPWC
jgi:hypothetical protein